MTAEDRRGKRKIIGVITVLLLLTAAAVLLFLFRKAEESGTEKSGTEKREDERGQVYLFRKAPELVFQDEDGETVRAEAGNGVAVLVFWASWCPHCRERLPEVDSLERLSRELQAEFFLVDKLDGEKETREQALSLLREKGVETAPLFDDGCEVYGGLGLRMVPTVLVLDAGNRVIAMTEGTYPSPERLEWMIEEAREGKAAALAKAVRRNLVGEDGGMRTNYIAGGENIPSGNDVLSESQGILMEYAALSGEAELFASAWGYVGEHCFAGGLMPWVVSDREETGVNALVDDLRIIGALQTAGERKLDCGINVDEEAGRYMDAVYEYNTEDGRLVDFYDWKSGQKARRFTLCYGDLSTLAGMAGMDGRFRKVYDNTLKQMLKGRISEKFPLYYSYFDYAEKKYEGGRLNMAEELTTLLHLSEVGQLPGEALDWLEAEMEERGCLYAAYDTEGNPAADGYYESTAVYALLAMLALSEDREELAGDAVNRMEQFRVLDGNEEWKGLFGNSDGTGIYSFDQGMALLAYERFEEATE